MRRNRARATTGRSAPAVLIRFGATLGTLLALMLLTALPALAHAMLLDSIPSDGEVVDGAPTETVLLFNEPMSAPATVSVTAPTGETVADGDAEIDGERVRMPLDALAGDGTYEVAWRAVSVDGHAIEGTFTFEVTGAEEAPPTSEPKASPDVTEPTGVEDEEPAEPDVEPTGTPELTDDPAAATDEDGGLGVLGMLLVGAALVALLAGGAASLANRRGSSEPE